MLNIPTVTKDPSGRFYSKIEGASTLFGVGEENECQPGGSRSANRCAHRRMKEEAQQPTCGDRKARGGRATSCTP
jgi:hypothetical protein